MTTNSIIIIIIIINSINIMSDIPVFISADGLSGSERRISLGWTIDQLRHKLEQFTGIPPSQQTLQLFTTATSPHALYHDPGRHADGQRIGAPGQTARLDRVLPDRGD